MLFLLFVFLISNIKAIPNHKFIKIHNDTQVDSTIINDYSELSQYCPMDWMDDHLTTFDIDLLDNIAEPTTEMFETLRTYAVLSSLSYCLGKGEFNNGPLKDACPMKNCQNADSDQEVIYNYQDKTCGLILIDYSKEEIWVIFKGTTSLDEWKIDIKYSPKKYIPYVVSQNINTIEFFCPHCKVHSGFQKSMDLFQKRLLPKLLSLKDKYPNYSFKFTGHSLGGALAVLAANEIRLLGFDVTLVTFGSPKFGNLNTTSWMDKFWNTESVLKLIYSGEFHTLPINSYTRVSHQGDIVTVLPLRNMGFAHSGVHIYLNKASLPISLSDVNIRGEWAPEFDGFIISQISKSIIEIIRKTSWGFLKLTKELKQPHASYFVKVTECKVL